MEILAIVSEYNPFHNGHRAQIRLLREKFGENSAIISCMSGDFVQRGEVALLDKQTRARVAMGGGVNLVLELGVLFSTSSADDFAKGALRSLAATGLPLRLCFGSEAGEIAPLEALAKLRCDAPEAYRLALQERLSAGSSFAAASAAAALSFLRSNEAQVFFSPDEYAALFSLIDDERFWLGPNNQLGCAYLAAARALTSGRRPSFFTHPRLGGAYLDENLHPTALSSAGALRLAVKQHGDALHRLLPKLAGHMPDASLAALAAARQSGNCLSADALSQLLAARLRCADCDELERYRGWDEGLAQRAKKLVETYPPSVGTGATRFNYWDALVANARSKRFPTARVQRAFVSLLLGIKKNENEALFSAGAPFYLRVLAADKTGRYLLRRMRKSARLPLFDKDSDYLEIGAERPEARRCAELDRRAADLRALLCGKRCGETFDKFIQLG